jgi:hypothetical protein
MVFGERVDYFWLTYATYFYVYQKFGFVRRDHALSLLTTKVCIYNSPSMMQAGVHKKENREVYRLIFYVFCSGYIHYKIFSSIQNLGTNHWCMDKVQ